MTSTQRRAEPQHRIWQIGNKVPRSVDSRNFRQNILAASFYHLISENFTSYIESINFVKLNQEIKTTVTKISKFHSDIDVRITEVEGA